MVIVVLGSAGR
jgi:D-alanyl-D-alanine carboxypeptidase